MRSIKEFHSHVLALHNYMQLNFWVCVFKERVQKNALLFQLSRLIDGHLILFDSKLLLEQSEKCSGIVVPGKYYKRY